MGRDEVGLSLPLAEVGYTIEISRFSDALSLTGIGIELIKNNVPPVSLD